MDRSDAIVSEAMWPGRKATMVAMSAIVMLGGSIAFLALRETSSPPLAAPPPSDGDGRAWHEGSYWRADVTGTGPDRPTAAATARHEALSLLLLEIERDLPQAIRALGESGPSAVAIFETHPIVADLEMLALEPRRQAMSERIAISYRVSTSSIERAKESYARTIRAWGIDLVHAPPSRAPGVLVLAPGTRSDIGSGDRVIGVDDRRIDTLDEIREITRGTLIIERTTRTKVRVRPAR
jgi:hypothetical protein